MIMSTIRAPMPAAGLIETVASAAAGALRRAFTGYMQARQRSIDRRVALHLERMGEERLLQLGFSAADIEAINAGETVAGTHARRKRRMA
jgi:hypothetical protein